MPQPQLTVQEALSVPVPELVLDGKAPFPYKPSPHWRKVDPQHVTDWDDFTLSNLRKAYGHIFDLPCCLSIPITKVHTHHMFRDVDELKRHGVETLLHLLRYPLRDALPKLAESFKRSVDNVHFEITAPYCPEEWKWGVFYGDTTNLVVCCARLSTEFSSKDLLHWRGDSTGTMQELATFAANGETPYGFILTDKEVVVVRFHQSSRKLGGYGAEWKAIPWDLDGDGELTPSLALFSLVLMSLNDIHRIIAPRPTTYPLTTWVREEYEGQEIYRHFSSQLPLTGLPEGVSYCWELTRQGCYAPVTLGERI